MKKPSLIIVGLSFSLSTSKSLNSNAMAFKISIHAKLLPLAHDCNMAGAVEHLLSSDAGSRPGREWKEMVDKVARVSVKPPLRHELRGTFEYLWIHHHPASWHADDCLPRYQMISTRSKVMIWKSICPHLFGDKLSCHHFPSRRSYSF